MTQCHKATARVLADVLCFVGLFATAGCGGATAPERVTLLRSPFLGLACHDTAYPCRKLGLAVWLPRAAHAVTADVDGDSVTLAVPRGRRPERGRAFWQGFFRDARAERYCAHYPHALAVTIHVSPPEGGELVASGRPIVSCGYG